MSPFLYETKRETSSCWDFSQLECVVVIKLLNDTVKKPLNLHTSIKKCDESEVWTYLQQEDKRAGRAPSALDSAEIQQTPGEPSPSGARPSGS